MFSYDAARHLTPLGSGSFPAPEDINTALVSKDGSHLYTASPRSRNIQCHALGADGIFSAMGEAVRAGEILFA